MPYLFSILRLSVRAFREMNCNQISDSKFKQFTRSLFNSFIQKLSLFPYLNTGNFTALYFIEDAIVDLFESRTDDLGKTIAILTYNVNACLHA